MQTLVKGSGICTFQINFEATQGWASYLGALIAGAALLMGKVFREDYLSKGRLLGPVIAQSLPIRNNPDGARVAVMVWCARMVSETRSYSCGVVVVWAVER